MTRKLAREIRLPSVPLFCASLKLSRLKLQKVRPSVGWPVLPYWAPPVICCEGSQLRWLMTLVAVCVKFNWPGVASRVKNGDADTNDP